MLKRSLSAKLLVFLAVVTLSVAVAVIPNIISDEVGTWFKKLLGSSYKIYLIGIFLLASIVLVFFSQGFTKIFQIAKPNYQNKYYNIVPNQDNRKVLKSARTAIGSDLTAEALQLISQIRSQVLKHEITLLSSRLEAEQRNQRIGVLKADELSQSMARIRADVLSLIEALEKEFEAEEERNYELRRYLMKRYEDRLCQKLSGRQALELKYIPSAEGTSGDTHPYFVYQGQDEIPENILQIFKASIYRLLVVGDPGAGKTTLLLQLALALLQSEEEAIPIILNLATWKQEFITLDIWLAELLPTELRLEKRYATELLQQNRLVLFLDGFDEIKKSQRYSALGAIGQYSSTSERRFVISSRKKEYTETRKDAPVYAQIEVRPLSPEQLIQALEQIKHQEPEAKPLILALQKDPLLAEVAQIPFYLNLLQLLFAGNNRLPDFHFSSSSLEKRREELLHYFIQYNLSPNKQDDYTIEQFTKWLSYLASRLRVHSIVNFELIHLQYHWWFWKKKHLLFPFLLSLLAGSTNGFLLLCFVLGLSVSLPLLGLTYVLIWLMTTGIIAGVAWLWLLGKNTLPQINTTENLSLSKKLLLKTLLVEGKTILINSVTTAMVVMLILQFFLKQSWNLAANLTVATLASTFTLQWFAKTLSRSHYAAIAIQSPFHRFYTSLKRLHFSLVQHIYLGIQLKNRGLLPYPLVPFLNNLAQRHILESDGSTWRFQHQLLQDFFIAAWEPQYQYYPKLKEMDAYAYYNLGNVLDEQGNLEAAIEQYQKAIQLNPHDAYAYNNLGNALDEQGNLEAAIEQYQKAIQLNSDAAYVYRNLGNALYNQGNLEAAIDLYQKAIKLNPYDATAHYNLGLVLFNRGNSLFAIEHYRKAIELNPNNAITYYNLGLALFNRGNLQAAIEQYQKAIELDPDNPATYYNLGLALYNRGNLEAAVEQYQKAIELTRGVAIYQNLGLALAQFHKVIEQNPDNEDAYHNLRLAFNEILAGLKKRIQKSKE